MFPGINELRLNEDTMIVAVEEYLAKRMVGAPPKVTDVAWLASEHVFRITLDGE